MTLLDVYLSGGRGICPTCGGGSQRERSLKVWRTSSGVLKGKCYRNSCGRRFSGVAGTDEIQESRKDLPTMQFVAFMNDTQAQYHLDRCRGLDGEPKPIILGGREGLAFPLRTADKRLVGWSVKHYTNLPKSTSIYFDTAPGKREIGWFSGVLQASKKPLLIVEDCLSACIASKYLPTVALCGTVLTLDNLVDILHEKGVHHNGHLLFALDRDAYTKALMYATQFAGVAETGTISLRRDIKDMLDNEIEELLHI